MGRLALLLTICLGVLLLDQATKFWAVGALTKAFEVEGAETFLERFRAFRVMEFLEPLRRDPVVVLEDHWRFRYLENPGAAWGLFGNLPPELRIPFFRIAPSLAIVALGALYFRAAKTQRWLRISLAMLIGGALGNFADRWLRGYVIDFIDWHWDGRHWPTFNVADVAISLGIAMVAFDGVFLSRWRRRAAIVASLPPDGGEPQQAPSEDEPPVGDWNAERL